ncbi:unnamed protein product [Schistosoma rodhaini]|uniref:LRRCT domain-containing protein n=1 Tax=Schistosoma rodhaini TaxID=6188 RepID=A0AA85FMY3_9TREM|nr:unnamed protein product [Schistosoma rodhaini]
MCSLFILFIKIFQLKEYILYLLFIPWTIAQSSNCLSGCKCSINSNDGNGFNTIAVICCLINQTRLSQLNSNNYPSDIKHCGYDLINHYYDPIHNMMIIWPNHTLCLPLWRQLKIQLTENSWSSLILSKQTKLHIQSKCMIELERLAIVGQLNVYDGFIQLDTNQFRNHIFSTITTSTSTTTRTIPNNGVALKLRRFTIEQTSLHTISQGFFDEIGANHLIDLEIRRNINLTEHGLGIGWLANIKHLQSLDLSLNHLYQINLASWGLPKHYPSLHNLDLSGNYLIHLKDQIFIRLPNLIYLNLANNYLTTLSSNVFQGLSHLKVLDLQGNQLRMYSLIVTMPNLNIILPHLKQLILSRNPLAVIPTSNVINNISSQSSSLKWWFTNSCPKLMTTLYLENIGLVKYNRSQSNSLQLPIINWEYCNSLTDIYLTYNDDWLKCIDHQWLNGINNGSNVHLKFRIHPSTLKLCPNHNVIVTKSDQLTDAISSTTTTTSDGGGDDTSLLGITHVRTTSISIQSVYWPVSNQDNVHAQNIHNPNQKNTIIGSNINSPSINSWIILCIIVFLIFVVFFTIVFAIMYCIRYLNKRLNKQISYTSDMMINGLHHHEQQQFQKAHLTPDFSTYKPAINMDTSSRILSPYSFNCMELNKANQLFHYTDFHPMCNSCFSFKRHAVTQPVSPADSGLEDSTPLTLQQTRHIFPSIDRRSIRSSRRSHHHHNHRPFLDTKFTRCPSTSVSSSLLLLQHSPNHHIPEMSYGWPISMNLSSNRVNAATSTDDVSIGPASTSVDTGEDACSSTPSDKAIIVNLCQESMQQNTTTATITTNNNSNDNNNNSNNNND